VPAVLKSCLAIVGHVFGHRLCVACKPVRTQSLTLRNRDKYTRSRHASKLEPAG